MSLIIRDKSPQKMGLFSVYTHYFVISIGLNTLLKLRQSLRKEKLCTKE